IRLWRKLGLSCEQTDSVACAFFPSGAVLDTGFQNMLPAIGFLYGVADRLEMSIEDDLDGLVSCWADIGTTGPSSLYARMFLNKSMLAEDAASVFAPDVSGVVLSAAANVKLLPQEAALCGALNLTGDEFELITGSQLGLGFDGQTRLTLPNVSAIYRRGW